MIRRLQHRNFLVAAGCTLLLSACSGASAPATTSAPSGAATSVPNTGASAPTQASSAAAASLSSTVAGSSVDPCSLLTQSEVDNAAGQPLGEGMQIGALDDCQWSTADFSASVELDVGDWTVIKAKAAETGQALTSVPGVGDEALTLNRAGNAAELFVRTGTVGFELLLGGQYIDTLPDLGLAPETVLAAAVLGRL